MATLIGEAGGQARTALLEGKTHSAANHELGQQGDTTGAILIEFIRDVTGRW